MVTREWSDEMNVTASAVNQLVKASPLPNEAAVLAVLIGVVSIMRVDGLDEERLLREARHTVPRADSSRELVFAPV